MNGLLKNMDGDKINKLDEMLRNGTLDRETYDEIVGRWNSKADSASTGSKQAQNDPTGRQRSGRVRISGFGNLSDVFAHELSISGAGTVEGPVDSDIIHISGSGKINGNVKSSESLEVSGSARIEGPIEANDIEASGFLGAQDIRCKSLESSGSMRVSGSIVSDVVECSGLLESKSLDAGTIKSSGSLKTENVRGNEIFISGKINSDQVNCKRFEMETYGESSRIGDLNSDIVGIKRQRWRFFSGGSVHIEKIKCNRGNFEGVKSKHISGDELNFGDGCEIEYAEGKTIRESDGARIKEKKFL